MVENVVTIFGIALKTTTVQKLCPFPVLVAAILNPLSMMSDDVDVVMVRSAVVENVVF